MACRGRSPCACADCGPFLLDSRGETERLTQVPLGALLGRGAHAAGRRANTLPLGAHLETRWRGEGAWPLDFDAAATSEIGYLRRGGRRHEAGRRGPRVPRPRDVTHLPPGSLEPGPSPATTTPPRIPIGARPSVPPRPPPNLARIDEPRLHPMAPHEPYGMRPQGLVEAHMYGPPVYLDEGRRHVPSTGYPAIHPGGGVPIAHRDQPLVQHVPAVPAQQETCIVNRFRPEWGTPPGWYNGVPLDFDPSLGAYTFNSARDDYVDRLHEYREQTLKQQLEGGPVDPALYSFMRWHNHLASQYRSGFMLQPYKSHGDERWRTRWIPQRRAVSCHTD